MEANTRPCKKPRRSAGDGLTAFALRLANQFAAADGGRKNLIFSPLSIYTALALVAAGARGTTLDELLALLGATSRDELAEFVRDVAVRALADASGSGGPLVAWACGVWHEKTLALKPAYREAAVESYKAETRAADFQNKAEEAREEINKWVVEATNKLITSILSPKSVHSDTALVLASAIYFKGRWENPFAKKHTEDDKFYLLDGSSVEVPFMQSRKDQLIARHDGFKVLKLPYQMQYRTASDSDDENPRFSMFIFLADEHNGLPSLFDKMASSPGFLHDHLPRRRVKVGKFQLPKFKLSFSSQINGALQNMGVKAAFKDGEADLSDMVEGSSSLALEHVFHKAVVEVNEEGTEAAAITACTSRAIRQCARRPVDFVADHPFVFFIVEEASDAVVFVGHVLDPSIAE